MIVFHDQNGRITGHQTFPATYSGPDAHIVVGDAVSLTNKKVSGGALVPMTQEEIDAEVAASAAAAMGHWRSTCEVTRRQAIIALYNIDNGTALATVQTAVDAAGGVTKIEWENALTFKRNNATVLALTTVLGWNADQLDDLFQAAQQVAD